MSDDSMAPRWLSSDAPTITNTQGGKQSDTPYAFTELDPHAMFVLTEILYTGREKYGKNNWRLISVEDHINHALVHINAYMAGDNQDDHLGHAFCRLMFAIGVQHDKVNNTLFGASKKDPYYCRVHFMQWCDNVCCRQAIVAEDTTECHCI